MERLAPLSAADWLRERFPAPDSGFQYGAGLEGIVPSGFPRYVRILHPTERMRPIGMAWPELLELHAEGRYGETPEFESEPASWADVATAFGKNGHPLVQFLSIIGSRDPQTLDLIASDGWQYDQPSMGLIPLNLLTSIMQVLVGSSPAVGDVENNDLTVAIWEGWGGLTSIAGASALFGWVDEQRRCRTFHLVDRFRRYVDDKVTIRFPKKSAAPGTGTLSKEAATADRLELPHRNYILFAANHDAFLDPEWPTDAPWADGTHPQTPSLIWPADRSWVLVNEIDFDSTIIACDDAMAEALLSHPDLEAFNVSFDSDLSRDGDTINVQ